MDYLTLSGNNIISARLPHDAEILYAPRPVAGIRKPDVPHAVAAAFQCPMGMPALGTLVDKSSRILIAFDDNCQPFPQTRRPDIREQALEALLPLLYANGVQKSNIQMLCAVALHRKMKQRELERMVGRHVMREFYPRQLENFDAEDRDNIVDLGETHEGEPVHVARSVVEADLVIYIDAVQIPLNGGHKSVAVGLGDYESIASHHNPAMTLESPHVMQPEGSRMHASIERISRVIQKHSRIMVMEAVMNNATYPPHVSHLGKAPDACGRLQRIARGVTPKLMAVTPEPIRKTILRGVHADYDPIEINAGDIDAVHARTLEILKTQMRVSAHRQFDTMVFGLADLSPYAVGARINPVLVISDVLGYVFNWFYNRPLVKKGGAVIILNPVFELFHPEYHVPYKKFYDEVLTVTTDPTEMRTAFEKNFARDPYLIECYRHRFAHHGFHPFTVWYWTTYALRYLSKVILVGPRTDAAAKRLGASWAPNLEHALSQAGEATGGHDVAAVTIPPFFYVELS
ncbi:MAG: lactate racemase domain-containing protein [Phycisphaerae bacterium]